MPFCSKCGTQNQDAANVCSSCGNNLNPTPNIFGPVPNSGGFFDKIKSYIDELLLFFDSEKFFKISWKYLFYYLQATIYALAPLGAIVLAVKSDVFDMPAKIVVVLAIAFIFFTLACFLSLLVIRSRTKSFDEATKDFSTNKVSLGNFYEFFKIAFVHTIETTVYASGIFASVAVFGLAFCSLFADIIRGMAGEYILAGFIVGPLYAYINIFITKIIVLFLKVFLEYVPKLFIMPIKALYNLFGIIIETRHNLWK